MRRLLQGDVGSGKTVVAACAALMALECGYNVLLMAPTEVLAEQHFSNFARWFVPLRLQVVLRTGSGQTVRGENGAGSMVVGTHALAQAGFKWPRVGLVVVDEQHKFGVAQRDRLVQQGEHLLVMSATPIPRTLGLTLYGDLDLSVLRGRPGTRGEVRTFIRPRTALPKVWEFTRKQLAQGRQAYVVYPRVEEQWAGGGRALVQSCQSVREALAPYRVKMLHGRMSAKEELMEAFRAGEIQVLLATSVIEVGLDVPNAAVMVVEDADLFGLAQLHQLRGRIGRGPYPAYCILVRQSRSQAARERLRLLEQTNDGFAIAEADLRLRGPGEFLGKDQSGLPPFRFAELELEWVERARQLAGQVTGR